MASTRSQTIYLKSGSIELDKVFTIGFTEKSAQDFFSLLKNSSVKQIFDVRLNNVSQLSGFAKKNDLKFFLKNLCDIEYVALPELAPESKMLKQYREKSISWVEYENRYLELLDSRNVEKIIQPIHLVDTCLLCSEHNPQFCHRRLALEYLNSRWPTAVNVQHLF
jgi:uncharacterized protein (DUF488 family)